MIDKELQGMTKIATDLTAEKAQDAQRAAAELRAQASQRAAEDQIRRWTRAMDRAFKGIVSGPERRRWLDKAVAHHER